MIPETKSYRYSVVDVFTTAVLEGKDARPRISNDNRKRRNGTDEDTRNRGGNRT